MGDLHEIKVNEGIVRDAIAGARSGWKLLVAAGGLTTALGTLLPSLHVKPAPKSQLYGLGVAKVRVSS